MLSEPRWRGDGVGSVVQSSRNCRLKHTTGYGRPLLQQLLAPRQDSPNPQQAGPAYLTRPGNPAASAASFRCCRIHTSGRLSFHGFPLVHSVSTRAADRGFPYTFYFFTSISLTHLNPQTDCLQCDLLFLDGHVQRIQREIFTLRQRVSRRPATRPQAAPSTKLAPPYSR